MVRTAVLGAAVAGWETYELTSATEAPSQAVLLLQYFFLACGLIALAASLFVLATQK
ncbi:MAG: hypothetical protein ACREB8_09955 [Pseudolabrys sp.]